MIHELHAALNETGLDSRRLRSILQQGIEIERLKLEVEDITSKNTLDSYISIMQCERFLHLLLAAHPCERSS